MFLSVRFQIIIYLFLLEVQQIRADNDTYPVISEEQADEIKTSSYMQNNDLINMKVSVINATSIKIQLHISDKQPLNYRTRPLIVSKFKDIKVNITAELLYTQLNKYHSSLLCRLKERVLMEQKPAISLQMCRKEMFSFRAFNSETRKFDIQMSSLCDCRKESHSLDVDRGYFIVSGLLPSQNYKFNILLSTLINGYVTPLETKEEYVCMPPGLPHAAPQTDLASYTLAPAKKQDSDLELISLYWRPLPIILVAGPDIRYNIYCEDDYHRNTHNITAQHALDGNISFYKPKDKSLMCKVRSGNSTHYGTAYSPIVIPDGNHRIHVSEKFRFYAYAISNEEYMFEWTPIEINSSTKEVFIHTSKVLDKNLQIKDGYFTIYWCIPGRAAGCSSLEGLWQVNTTQSNLIFPDRTTLTPRMFGISYTHYNPPMSTGIIWSDCESTFGHQFIHEQLSISKAVSLDSDHTSLAISWAFPSCDAQAAAIDYYEINYCKVSQLTGCSMIWSNHPVFNLSDFPAFSDKQCETIQARREFQESAIIHNLSPASKYVVRIRYMLGNGTRNSWSETKWATTSPDPEITHRCRRAFILKAGIAAIALIVVFIFLTVKTLKWLTHFKVMRSRFKKTTGGICSFVTKMNADRNTNDVIFKYCANTGKDEMLRSKSELSLGFLRQEESLRLNSLDNQTLYDDKNLQSDYNAMNQIFDYIPKNLMDGGTQDTTSETSSNNTADMIRFEHSSERDEISLNSNHSIWESTSNLRMDFNNNQPDHN